MHQPHLPAARHCSGAAILLARIFPGQHPALAADPLPPLGLRMPGAPFDATGPRRESRQDPAFTGRSRPPFPHQTGQSEAQPRAVVDHHAGMPVACHLDPRTLRNDRGKMPVMKKHAVLRLKTFLKLQLPPNGSRVVVSRHQHQPVAALPHRLQPGHRLPARHPGIDDVPGEDDRLRRMIVQQLGEPLLDPAHAPERKQPARRPPRHFIPKMHIRHRQPAGRRTHHGEPTVQPQTGRDFRQSGGG